MKPHPAIVIIVFLALGGCDRIEAGRHSYDDKAVARFVPPPPVAGVDTALYPDTGGPDTGGEVAIEARPGDCAKVTCFRFQSGRWRILPAGEAGSLALLSVDAAADSAYGDDLWTSGSSSRNGVLVNRRAGADNIVAGRFDGLRIGLRQDNGTGYQTHYAVAYAVETGTFLKSHNRCLTDKTDGSHCARRIGDNLYLSVPDAEVYMAGDKAWLLFRRADSSADVVDLHAAFRQTDPALCAPGLYLDSAPAGDYKSALSPDIFLSKTVDPGAGRPDRERLACFRTKAKAIP